VDKTIGIIKQKYPDLNITISRPMGSQVFLQVHQFLIYYSNLKLYTILSALFVSFWFV